MLERFNILILVAYWSSRSLNLYPMITKLKLRPRRRNYISFGSPASLFLRAKCRKCASVKTLNTNIPMFLFLLNWRFTTQFRLLKILYKKTFKNIVGKGENAGNQHFLLFPECFPKTNFSSWIIFTFSSANALIFVYSKILLFS